jgi:hypothetical protein
MSQRRNPSNETLLVEWNMWLSSGTPERRIAGTPEWRNGSRNGRMIVLVVGTSGAFSFSLSSSLR